jgi:hypothetical protein
MALAIFLAPGCATQPVKQSVPFSELDFEPYIKDGSGSVSGSAFMKTRGGDVKVGAGCLVELIPYTPYTAERFDHAMSAPRSARMEPRDSRLDNYVRKTLADAQGNFEFKNVPSGKYYVACVIEWEVASGYGLQKTGAQAVLFVSLQDGESKRVVLTRQ